jgi:fatty-acyl-CoA synthase
MMFELDWLKKWSQFSGGKIALHDLDTDVSLTYTEFYQQVLKWSHLLRHKYSVNAGDRVALLATNRTETLILFFALQRLSAILVPINYRLTPTEINFILQDCQPKLLIFETEFSVVAQSAVENTDDITLIDYLDLTLQAQTHADQFTDFLSTADSAVMIIYTSGTTGFPKGAVLTQQMLFWNSINTTMRLNITDQDKTITFAPFFHTGGWNVLTTPLLHRGATVCLIKKFEADRILTESAKLRCTILFGVPTMMDMMARSSQFKTVDLKSVRYAIVGGEPMPVELIKKWHQKNIPIRQGYGLTEFGPNVFSLNEQDAERKIGSIGFANFYCQARVIDDSGKILGPNQIGELQLKGPMCMQGYWNNSAATTETIVDGWLKTGDLVKHDEEGFYFVIGRKKEMIKSGGENIYPAEIERILRQFPQVREAAVVGRKDEKWGEVGRAFIATENNQDFCLEDLQQFCVKHLAKYKVPKEFILISELPKSDSGKILKRKLSEQNLI